MKLRDLSGTHAIFFLTAASVVAAVTTFLALNGAAFPFQQNPDRIWLLLLIDVALLLALAGMIARGIGRYWRNFRRGIAQSKLLTHIVLSFCIVTALPTVVVSLFSALFFNLGIEAWFNDRVNTAVEESLVVAEAYLIEHRENVRADALALADDINRLAGMEVSNPLEFNRFVSAQAARRRLTEVVVFQKNHIIAQGRLSFAISFGSLPENALERAADGEVVILQADEGDTDKVRALTRLDGIEEGYLLVGRLLDDKVITHMENTQGAVNAYRDLKRQLVRLQWTFSAVFVMLSAVLLLAAVWYGLVFAGRLTTPITRLASAAERVRAGDYSGRVEVSDDDNEISTLSRTFNRMVDQLDTQRRELIAANRELDDRRRFSEAVLGGVSAGVIALNHDKYVTLFNRSAIAMLESTRDENTLQGRHINEILPGIQELLMQAETMAGDLAQSSITLGSDASARTLHVRVTAEGGADAEGGYIVTFDDITPLVAAQRNAAWSDVARRVAHEIKNPLTPISLSAERLKRKYLKYVEGEEAESFVRYIDTISRHAADIGRMVEEFVSFARMPGAVMKEANLLPIVRQVLFSEQVAHPTIQYRLSSEESAIMLLCDERQLAQILSNILKNAAEAIEGEQAQSAATGPAAKGEISIRVNKDATHAHIVIEDSGPGFPPDKILGMLEPYVTTRAKGTGLGLAIVKKIVEEHDGTMQLANRPEGGARVTLSFLQQCDIKVANEWPEVSGL